MLLLWCCQGAALAAVWIVGARWCEVFDSVLPLPGLPETLPRTSALEPLSLLSARVLRLRRPARAVLSFPGYSFGVKREKVPLLPGKAPFSKRFEDAVGLACEMASARQVARQFGLAASTVRAIDLRYLERWNASRRTPALRQMGVDEIYLGKKQKFLSVVSNLETGEPLWFGRDRKKESLDSFFQTELSARQRRGIEAACVDMWEPYRRSIEQWAPNCQDHL
jgi:transposase